MAASFAAFARTGDPSTPTAVWPPVTDGGATMVFDGSKPHVRKDVDRDLLTLMAEHPSRLFPRG